MRRRSLIVAAAMVAGLALGFVVGPMFQAGSASAQTAPTQTAPDPSGKSALWTAFLDNLASTLGIQRTALDTAITTAGNQTADDAVAAGTLTQAQADALKARIAAGDTGALWGGRGGPGGRGPGRGAHGELGRVMVEAAASKLGITVEELHTQLRSGQTLAQIATANNTTEQAVVDAALAAAKTKLGEAVTAGTLTQAQADAIYADLEQRGADLLTPRGRGDGRGPRGSESAPAPTPAPATQEG